MKKIIVCAAAFIMAVSGGAAAYADTLISEDGLRYVCSDSGEKSLYTGWTDTKGVKKYYKNGKRCAGWHKINGNYYYLPKTGGFAAGYYQIGDNVYEFDYSGRYTGVKSSVYDYDFLTRDGNKPTRLEEEACFSLANAAYLGDGKYLDDYTCVYWDSEKLKYTVMLTDFDRVDFYKGLTGGCDSFVFEKAEYPRNYYSGIDKIVCDADIFTKYKIYSCGYESTGNIYDIKVTDESMTEPLREYILEQGIAEDSFSVSFEPNPLYDE